MLEPPDLPNELITAAIEDAYGPRVAVLAFLPLGRDVFAWAYRLQAADGSSYFLKVRQGAVRPASLLVPRFLHDRGVTEVVARLPALSGALSVPLGEFSLLLYPFIEGETGMDRGMSEQQWRDYGAVLRRIHA